MTMSDTPVEVFIGNIKAAYRRLSDPAMDDTCAAFANALDDARAQRDTLKMELEQEKAIEELTNELAETAERNVDVLQAELAAAREELTLAQKRQHTSDLNYSALEKQLKRAEAERDHITYLLNNNPNAYASDLLACLNDEAKANALDSARGEGT
jgi:hypothetical protein